MAVRAQHPPAPPAPPAAKPGLQAFFKDNAVAAAAIVICTVLLVIALVLSWLFCGGGGERVVPKTKEKPAGKVVSGGVFRMNL